MQVPHILKNYNLFINGIGFAGRVKEVTLPVLEIATEEFKAAGMVMPMDLDMGMQKLTCSMVLNEYNPEALRLFGLGVGSTASVTLKGVLDNENGQDAANQVKKIEVKLNGMWTSIDMGTWIVGESQSLTLSMSATYYKVSIANEDLIEIDVLNMVRKIGDNDVYEGSREILGI